MADESRTEQATPRRQQRARREGDVPRSRELPAALAVMTVVLFVWWYPQNWKDDWRNLLERSLTSAARTDMATGALQYSIGWRGESVFGQCPAWLWLGSSP